MNLFLILSLPLWLLFLNSFYKNVGLRKRDLFIPLGKGSMIFIGSLLLTWLFTIKLNLGRVTPMRVFLYDFLFYNGLTNIIWLSLFFIIQLLGSKKKEKIRTREIMFFMAPLFWGDSLYRVIIQESWYGPVEFFLIPLTNMALLVILTLLITRGEKADLFYKFLYFLISLFFVLIANLVPFFASYNMLVLSIISTLVFLFLSFFIFFREITR